MLGLNVYLSRYCLVAIVYFTLSISGCVFAFTYFYCPVLHSEAIATPYLSGGFSQ